MSAYSDLVGGEDTRKIMLAGREEMLNEIVDRRARLKKEEKTLRKKGRSAEADGKKEQRARLLRMVDDVDRITKTKIDALNKLHRGWNFFSTRAGRQDKKDDILRSYWYELNGLLIAEGIAPLKVRPISDEEAASLPSEHAPRDYADEVESTNPLWSFPDAPPSAPSATPLTPAQIAEAEAAAAAAAAAASTTLPRPERRASFIPRLSRFGSVDSIPTRSRSRSVAPEYADDEEDEDAVGVAAPPIAPRAEREAAAAAAAGPRAAPQAETYTRDEEFPAMPLHIPDVPTHPITQPSRETRIAETGSGHHKKTKKKTIPRERAVRRELAQLRQYSAEAQRLRHPMIQPDESMARLINDLAGHEVRRSHYLGETIVPDPIEDVWFGTGHSATHRANFLRTHHLKDKGYSLKELSHISYVPLDILQEVYNRGIGAYSSSYPSVRLKGSYVKGVANAPKKAKLSKEQWAYARVYSFLDGNPRHDNDLRRGGGRRNPFGCTDPSCRCGL
jgi:hypothetical protein